MRCTEEEGDGSVDRLVDWHAKHRRQDTVCRPTREGCSAIGLAVDHPIDHLERCSSDRITCGWPPTQPWVGLCQFPISILISLLIWFQSFWFSFLRGFYDYILKSIVPIDCYLERWIILGVLGLVCMWDFYGIVRSFSNWIFGSLCNPYNSVFWLRSSPFCLENVGKLSNLVKRRLSHFLFCIRFMLYSFRLTRHCRWSWRLAYHWWNSSGGRNKWYQSIPGNSPCDAPIPQVRRRHCDVYTQVRNTLTYIR